LSARSKARKRALDILFQADVRGEDLPAILAAEAKRAANEPAREASWLYAREIVDGVIDNRDAIDEQITTFAKDWSLARMPAVDRAVLRLGTFELLAAPHVPTAVVLSEWVTLAGDYSTTDSSRFVNGVLSRIAEEVRPAGDAEDRADGGSDGEDPAP
jgi:N utilization substance protein B